MLLLLRLRLLLLSQSLAVLLVLVLVLLEEGLEVLAAAERTARALQEQAARCIQDSTDGGEVL